MVENKGRQGEMGDLPEYHAPSNTTGVVVSPARLAFARYSAAGHNAMIRWQSLPPNMSWQFGSQPGQLCKY